VLLFCNKLKQSSIIRSKTKSHPMKTTLLRISILTLLCFTVPISHASEDLWKAPLEDGRNYTFVLAPSSVSSEGSSSDIILTPQPMRLRVLAFNGANWIKVQHLTNEDGKLVLASNQPFWLNLTHVVAYREIAKEQK